MFVLRRRFLLILAWVSSMFLCSCTGRLPKAFADSDDNTTKEDSLQRKNDYNRNLSVEYGGPNMRRHDIAKDKNSEPGLSKRDTLDKKEKDKSEKE